MSRKPFLKPPKMTSKLKKKDYLKFLGYGGGVSSFVFFSSLHHLSIDLPCNSHIMTLAEPMYFLTNLRST